MVITRLSIEGGDRARRDSDSLLSTRGELIEAVEVGLETLSSPLSFASLYHQVRGVLLTRSLLLRNECIPLG